MHKENVYPALYNRVVGGKVHGVWQQDNQPGTSLNLIHPVVINNIRYAAWTEDDFINTSETCEIPDSLFADNITATGATLHWSENDGDFAYRIAMCSIYQTPLMYRKQPHLQTCR
jgi:hypothetical protein